MPRVKKYIRQVSRLDKPDRIDILEFSQIQANEIGAVLGPDGLDIVAAMKLCISWTRLGKHKDLTYTYRVCN